TPSSITLSWASAGGTTAAFRVYRNGAQIANPSAATFTDTALTASTTYTYAVAAVDATGNLSTQSPALSVTTATASVPAPANLTTSTITASQVALTWTSGGGSTAGFRVYRDGTLL